MLTWLFKGTSLVIISLVIASLALYISVLQPMGDESDGASEVTKIYFADNISEAHRAIIEQFNQANRGSLEVVPVNLPFTKFSTNERKQLLTRALRSKSTRIDIFAVDLVWVPRFVKWAEPMARHFSPEEQANFLPYALQSCFYENELVGVPLYLDIGVLYYRKDKLAALPDAEQIESRLKDSITWEEFIELSQRLNHSNNPYYVFPADAYEGVICCFIENVYSQNASIIAGDSLRFNTTETRRALQLLVDFVSKHHLTPAVVTTFKEIDVYQFALGNDATFFRGWPGNLRAYRAAYGEKIKNIAVAALPHFKNAKPAAVFGGWNLMIAKDSPKKAEAIQFIKFATSREIQKVMYEEMGYMPSNQQVYEDSTFHELHPELSYLRRLLATGVHRPSLVEYTKISDILSYYVNKAIRQEISVSAALQRAEEMMRSQKVMIN